MTLEELERTLPNGLHDAEVRRVVVDYEKRTLDLDVAVWVGDMDDPPERREAYRSGTIEISGLILLVMEPPAPSPSPRHSVALTIDACDRSDDLGVELLKSLPSGAFCRSLFVNDWNAFMHVAAMAAEITWTNGGAVTFR